MGDNGKNKRLRGSNSAGGNSRNLARLAHSRADQNLVQRGSFQAPVPFTISSNAGQGFLPLANMSQSHLMLQQRQAQNINSMTIENQTEGSLRPTTAPESRVNPSFISVPGHDGNILNIPVMPNFHLQRSLPIVRRSPVSTITSATDAASLDNADNGSVNLSSRDGTFQVQPTLRDMNDNGQEVPDFENDHHSLADTVDVANDSTVGDGESIDAPDLASTLREMNRTLRELKEQFSQQTKSIEDNTARVARLEEILVDRPLGIVGENNLPKRNLLPQFPLIKKRDFKAFVTSLGQNEEMQSQLKTLVLSLGGKDYKDKINQSMRKVMTYRLGKHYNWSGARHSKNFSELSLAKVLRSIFVDAQICDEYQAKHQMGEWLRRAGSRHIQVKKNVPVENESSGESGPEDDDTNHIGHNQNNAQNNNNVQDDNNLQNINNVQNNNGIVRNGNVNREDDENDDQEHEIYDNENASDDEIEQ